MGIVLSILSAILWSVFDVIRKKAVKDNSEISIILLIITSQLIFFLILLPLSTFIIDISAYLFTALILIILNLISIFLFLKVLKSGAISVYIPMLSFTPLFSALYSNVILNEELKSLQYLGMLLIVIGSLILHLNKYRFKNLINILFLLDKKAIMILLVALIWSLTPVLDKECLKYTDIYLHGFLQSLGMLLILPVLLNNTKKKTLYQNFTFRNNLVLCFLVIFAFLTTYFQLLALKYIYVAELESLKRAIGIILSLLFGYYLFKENMGIKKLFAVSVILIGVINTINFT